MSSTLEKEALNLFDQGIFIFLSNPATKRAIFPHSEYRPILEREHVIELCQQYPDANLQIVVGKDEGIVALGVGVGNWSENGEESFEELCEKHGHPETLGCAMPDGRRFYFFKYDASTFKVGDRSGLWLETGTCGCLVSPSTVDGDQVNKIGTATTVQSFSAWLDGGARTEESTISKGPEVEEVGPEAQATEGTPVEEMSTIQQTGLVDKVLGEDPAAAVNPVAQMRGEMVSWVATGRDKQQFLSMALQWNQDHGEQVKMEEIVSLLEELGETANVEVEALAGEELLFRLAEGTILFHDGLNDPYFHFEGVPFKAPSKDYEGIIQYRYYQKTRQMPKAKDLKNVMNVLRSKAIHEGRQINLMNRVSDKDGAIIYDLRDKRYLRVTPKGWEIIPAFPLYYKHKHQQAQVEPAVGGDPWKVFDFLPVEEENRLLIMVYLISLFVPRIAHPVLAVFGDQGSAKSCFCTVINKLVDPTLTEKVILPKNERDLIQTLRQKYVTVLDNLSKINDRVSDIFCQVCTGASISYRQLYTDEGENIAQFRHVIILNSISLAIANADLMDRSIILKCHRIKPEDRKPEDELWEAFEKARSGILGGIFDILVKAQAIYPTIETKRWPRLADFAKWGYAIAEALGQRGEKFIEDFSQNIKRQNESVAGKNVLCQTILNLMSDKDAFLKSVGDAHKALKNIAKEDAKDETFPKLPHLLRGSLEKLRTTLAEHNISFQFLEQRTAAGMKVLFSKTASPDTPSQTVETAPSKLAISEPSEPCVSDEADIQLPIVEFDELPEVFNA